MLLGLVGLPTYTWIKEKHSIFCGPVCYVVLTSAVDRYGVPTVFHHRSFTRPVAGAAIWHFDHANMRQQHGSSTRFEGLGMPGAWIRSWEFSSLGWTTRSWLGIFKGHIGSKPSTPDFFSRVRISNSSSWSGWNQKKTNPTLIWNLQDMVVS